MASKVVKPKVKTSIDIDKYVNTETGEVLSSEISKGEKLSVTKDGSFIIIESDNYTVVDSDALKYLQSILNRSEVGSVILMSRDLKTPLNIVYNNNFPHTNESLRNFLGFGSESKFLALIKKLMKAGVLYQIKGRIRDEIRVIYMLNPFIARKRKMIDPELENIFGKTFPIEIK